MDEAKPAAEDLERSVVEALKTCYDPEIPVDIYELGLIYGVAVDGESKVNVTMTLTTPHCPVAETLPLEVERRVRGVPGVADARVEIVWDPPWNPSMMSEAAKLELGF
jgi:FeS assembly SUF system protein